MKCILICSNKYKKRKDATIENLQRVGINNITTSDSVFISEYPEDFKDRKYIGTKRRKGLGTVGCYLAHINAIKKSLDFKEHCMICDDDVYLKDIFIEKIDYILKVVEDENPDIFFLNCKVEERKFKLYRNPIEFVAAHCYIVHRDSKGKILQEIQKYYGAIDKIYHKCESIKKYHVCPNLSVQFDAESIIDEIG